MRTHSWLLSAGLSATALVLSAAPPPATAQQTFATPREAIQAAIDAAERNDTTALLKIFGPSGKDLVTSGDPQEDKEQRAEFVRAAHEKLEVEEGGPNPDKAWFIVGSDSWPFPVPVIRQNDRWLLDSASGKIELLARRIGANELTVMDVVRGYAEAQLAYAAQPHDGAKTLTYARTAFSSPGKHDGLFHDEQGADSLVPRSFAEATVSASGPQAKPFHGYYFRILTAQGPQARGGALNYVVHDRMIGGFALVAWPAEYGVSGIRTFMINHDGVLFEKDLGAATATLAQHMSVFNPDSSWRQVTLE